MNIFHYVTQNINSGSARSSIVKKNILGSLFVKGIGMSTSFILVPITLNMLSVEKYGIWITLFSIVTWFNIMDIGLGNGFRNKFAEAIALGKDKRARHLVETLYGSTSLIAIVVFVIYFIIHPSVNWFKILNLPTTFDEDISLIILMVFGLFSIQLVLKNITSILLAVQKTALSNLINLLINLLSLTIILLLGRHNLASLYSIALIFMLSPIVIYSFATVILLKKQLFKYQPRSFKINKEHFKSMMGLGVKFFFIQITTIIMFTSGNFIVANLFGPKEVTPYNISYTLFASVIGVFNIFIIPFWSAYTEAFSKGDYLWIKNSLKKLSKLWLLFLIFIIALLIFSPFIFEIWIGNEVKVPFILSATFALYAALLSWTGMFSKFLNGVGKIKIQLYITIFQCLTNIPLAIFLAKYLGLGLSGVILATNLNLFIAAIILPIQVYKISNQKAQGIWFK